MIVNNTAQSQMISHRTRKSYIVATCVDSVLSERVARLPCYVDAAALATRGATIRLHTLHWNNLKYRFHNQYVII